MKTRKVWQFAVTAMVMICMNGTSIAEDHRSRAIYSIKSGGHILAICDGDLFFESGAKNQGVRQQRHISVETKTFYWKDDHIYVHILDRDRGKNPEHDASNAKGLAVDLESIPRRVYLADKSTRPSAWRMEIERESVTAITASIAVVTNKPGDNIWLAWDTAETLIDSPERASVISLRRPILVSKQQRYVFTITRQGSEESGK